MGARTRQLLIIWGNGDADSAYLAAGLVRLDGATDVDPVHPQGGPDGKKDILCTYKGARCVVAVHFPNDSNTVRFTAIKRKFVADLAGVKTAGREGFLFVTNVALTDGERAELEAEATAAGVVPCIIYHLERIHALLDHPGGYGLREEYLRMPLSEAEKVSFEQEKRVQDREAIRQAVNDAMAQHRLDIKLEIEATVKAALAQAPGSSGTVK